MDNANTTFKINSTLLSTLQPSNKTTMSLTSFPISYKFKPPYASINQTTTTPNQTKTGVIIIGAGLAGLAAATHLQSNSIPFLLLESSDSIGGRVRTDYINGYTFDRGFQIFITAYPEANKLLDYNALHLQRFYSGAKVFYNGKFHTVADPLRHFTDAVQSLGNPIGSVFDKLLIGWTRVKVLSKTDEDILMGKEMKTVDLLRGSGFSEGVLDRFFRPFFGGIFFDRELETTSRLFNFVFRCLALGDNTLPRDGIVAIPKQLADRLDGGSIRLNSRVVSIDCGSGEGVVVGLENGELVESELGVILAIEEFEAAKILDGEMGTKRVKLPVRSTVCVYFSVDADKVPVKDPVLFLNGTNMGIVNNMFFATNVAPSYAPKGKALVSVSLIGLYDGISDEELVERVVSELSDWFGKGAVNSWNYLRMYRIGFAQPNQCPPTDLMKDPRIKPGLYMCGDYVTSATFDGALVSGRSAVEALLKDRAKAKV